MREDLEESTLPFRVDSIDFARVEIGFRNIIQEHWVPIHYSENTKISKVDVSLADFEIVQDLIISIFLIQMHMYLRTNQRMRWNQFYTLLFSLIQSRSNK